MSSVTGSVAERPSVVLHRLWNQVEKADPALSWWEQNSKCTYQEAFRDLEKALRAFIKSRHGERKGPRLGFPRFKKRGRCKDSFRFSTGTMRCAGATVTLPRLGTVRTHESTRKLARRLDNGSARIVSATVSRTAQRWFVSFTCEVERQMPDRHPRADSAIGIDLGVTLLTGVDGAGKVITVDGPKALRSSLRRLRRASRAHSRKQPGSANRRKAAARLARVHARAANVRADALHKATTTLAASGAESVNACRGTARPGHAGHDPVKQEPGTAPVGKTGTAASTCGRRPGVHSDSLTRDGSAICELKIQRPAKRVTHAL